MALKPIVPFYRIWFSTILTFEVQKTTEDCFKSTKLCSQEKHGSTTSFYILEATLQGPDDIEISSNAMSPV